MAGDRRCSATVPAIAPGRGPRQFSRDESRRMNLNDDVVYRWLRLGPLHQLHPGRSRSLVRYDNRLHMNCLLGYLSLCRVCSSDESAVRHLMRAAMGPQLSNIGPKLPRGRYAMKSATVVPVDRAAGRSFPMAGMHSFDSSGEYCGILVA